jgi:hypothetical protein
MKGLLYSGVGIHHKKRLICNLNDPLPIIIII